MVRKVRKQVKADIPAEVVVSHSAEMVAWQNQVKKKFVLSKHHEILLGMAATAYDRATEAGRDIAKNGLSFVDRLGNVKARPSVASEISYSNLFARCLRELGLDIESADTPRPNKIRRSF